MMKFYSILFLIAGALTASVSAAENAVPIGSHYPPANDFTANWITVADKIDGVPNLWLAFRKSFDLAELPKDKTVSCRIAVDSKYWLYINGKLAVYEGGLKRGPSPNDTYFDVVDLKPFLKKGKNSVAVLVWYFGKSGFSHLDSGKPGLLFDSPLLTSDATWKARLYSAVPKGIKQLDVRARTFNINEFPKNWRKETFGPYEIVTTSSQPNYRLPEWNIRYDARYTDKGKGDAANWKSAAFDDSLWSNAVALGCPSPKPVAPWGYLFPRLTPLWKDYGLKNFESQLTFPFVSDGKPIELRLPYNAQISPWLKVEAKAGKTIDIRMDNYKGGSEFNVRSEYVTKNGIQEYESLGWMNGHAVIYTIPKGVKVLGLKYRETGYNAEFSDNFVCDDAFYNLLWKKSVRTLYITMRDTYFDCPDRERAQWWGDAVNELGEAFYAMSRSADLLPKKGLYELIRFQRADHSIFSPVPGNYGSELPAQMLATVGKFGLGTYSFYSGDMQTAKDLYPGIKRYLGLWEFEKGEGGQLVKVRKGSWSWGDWGKDIDLRPLLNCWYFLAVMEAKEIADSLGLQEDSKEWQRQLDSISTAFNKTFWTGKDYRDPLYKGRSDDRTNAMAVLCGFADEGKYPLLREHFRKEKNASPYMEKYVLEAICYMGYGDDALIRMKERFAKMVNHPDYTTLWEGWGIGSEGYGGGTINHAWSGGGLTCLAQYIVGLAPTKPAFREFSISPQLGNLKNVSLTVPTHYGKIAIAFNVTGETLKVAVDVPKGTKCLLNIPAEYKVEKSKPMKSMTRSYSQIQLDAGSFRAEYKK